MSATAIISARTWDAIWATYCQGYGWQRSGWKHPTFKDLAAQHGVSARTISRHASVHRWAKKFRAAQLRAEIASYQRYAAIGTRDARQDVRRVLSVLGASDPNALFQVACVARDSLAHLGFVSRTLHNFRCQLATIEGRREPKSPMLRLPWRFPPWYSREQRAKERAKGRVFYC
jgi:hypothetical protein